MTPFCASVAPIQRHRGRPVDVSAAVYPSNYRQVLVRGLGRRPDVEVQAIFAHCRRRFAGHGDSNLHACRGKCICLPCASPGRWMYRRPPTQVGHRRSREWDSFVDTQPICVYPRYCSGLCQQLLRDSGTSQPCRHNQYTRVLPSVSHLILTSAPIWIQRRLQRLHAHASDYLVRVRFSLCNIAQVADNRLSWTRSWR